MSDIRRISTNRWWHKKKSWVLFGLFLILVFVRISKGAIYKDFYYFISKPFWPGQFQKEILINSVDQELLVKLNQLEEDNKRFFLETHSLRLWIMVLGFWSICGLLILGVK